MLKPSIFCVTVTTSVTHEANAVHEAWWHVLPFTSHYCKNEKLLNVKLQT